MSAFLKSALVREGIIAGIAEGFDVNKSVAEEREVDHSGPIGEEFSKYIWARFLGARKNRVKQTWMEV